ncbi:odorant receptor 30a-like isoform X1 [Cylas formicarius]|uniref:odorant receptor 30a-like isoform X1 n=1 Tax=Cylas formicarius TaxID=197179 RepID=UPI0029587416|nr:odorant receptor 30a-like isoform X1 [Cylas formicarius]
MAATKEMFYYTRVIMILCGIWRLEIHKAPVTLKDIYPLYSAVVQIWNALTPILLGANLPTLFRSNNVAVAYETLTSFLYSAVLTLKISMCQMGILPKLIKLALDKERHLYSKLRGCNPALQQIYEEHVFYCNKLTKIFYLTVAGGTVFHLEFGIVDGYNFSKSQKHSNVTLSKPLPLHFWYPVDENKYYTWMLVDQLLKIALTAFYIAGFQSFSTSLFIFLRAQLKILQENFRNFHELEPWESSAFWSLRTVCLKHQEFIGYVEDLNKWIKPIILIEYGTSSVMCAGLLFQIIAEVNVAFNVVFVFILWGQLMLLAWNCNEVLIESANLAKALYESEWYEQDARTKVLIYTMILRCQKPLTLNIGPFGPMTADAALSRIKMAYSYTTLMTGDDLK